MYFDQSPVQTPAGLSASQGMLCRSQLTSAVFPQILHSRQASTALAVLSVAGRIRGCALGPGMDSLEAVNACLLQQCPLASSRHLPWQLWDSSDLTCPAQVPSAPHQAPNGLINRDGKSRACEAVPPSRPWDPSAALRTALLCLFLTLNVAQAAVFLRRHLWTAPSTALASGDEASGSGDCALEALSVSLRRSSRPPLPPSPQQRQAAAPSPPPSRYIQHAPTHHKQLADAARLKYFFAISCFPGHAQPLLRTKESRWHMAKARLWIVRHLERLLHAIKQPDACFWAIARAKYMDTKARNEHRFKHRSV